MNKLLYFTLLILLPLSAIAQELPQDFVRLKDIDATIVQDIRYYGANNFMGRTLSGYEKPECILHKDAALALKNIQAALVKTKETLVIFDCYRPRIAVLDMVSWVNSGEELNSKYYPQTSRAKLIENGYISDKSNHSRGYTVDLAIGKIKKPWFDLGRKNICGNRKDKNTLDFGTPFDCFDKQSATDFENINSKAKINRLRLKTLMKANGFNNYADEWWHYTLAQMSKDAPYFDFIVH